MNHAGSRHTLTADLALLLCALFWGMSFVTMKRLVSLYSPCWLLFLRFGPGAVLLLLAFPKRILRTWRKNLRAGAVIGTILFAAIAVQTVALNFIGAGRQAFISATYVLLVPLLLWGFRHTFPGWATLSASALCLLGMGLLSDPSGPLNPGDALTFLSALLFAGQIIAIGHYTQRPDGRDGADCDPIAISFVEFTTLTLLCLAARARFASRPRDSRSSLLPLFSAPSPATLSRPALSGTRPPPTPPS